MLNPTGRWSKLQMFSSTLLNKCSFNVRVCLNQISNHGKYNVVNIFSKLAKACDVYASACSVFKNEFNCELNPEPFFSFAQAMTELPVHIHEKHHILFIFYHIGCESSSKASNRGVESLGKSPPLHQGNLCPHECGLYCKYMDFCSGLLVDAFAERWKDAVSRAPIACGCDSACWIPVSGHQEGAIIFLSACTQQPRSHEQHQPQQNGNKLQAEWNCNMSTRHLESVISK